MLFINLAGYLQNVVILTRMFHANLAMITSSTRGLGLVLGFYSVRHLMNGWDLKYTFSPLTCTDAIKFVFINRYNYYNIVSFTSCYLIIILFTKVIYLYQNVSETRSRWQMKVNYCFKEYYEIVGESRPLSAFSPTHADFFTEMHFCSWN